jgi:hypothetical protein
MIMCQARNAPGGCCWHVGCLRESVRDERECATARRALAIPHSRLACLACRPGVVPLGPGMGRYDVAGVGFESL